MTDWWVPVFTRTVHLRTYRNGNYWYWVYYDEVYGGNLRASRQQWRI